MLTQTSSYSMFCFPSSSFLLSWGQSINCHWSNICFEGFSDRESPKKIFLLCPSFFYFFFFSAKLDNGVNYEAWIIKLTTPFLGLEWGRTARWKRESDEKVISFSFWATPRDSRWNYLRDETIRKSSAEKKWSSFFSSGLNAWWLALVFMLFIL